MRSIKLFLFLLLVQSAVAQRPAVSFNGVVTDAASTRPLPRTTLELQPVGGNPTQVYPGLSNENGEFVFQNIPAGNYTLTAAHNGYVRTDLGQRGPNGKGTPLSLAAGRQPSAIRMALTQSAAISGRISDPSGAPFPYVQVYAKRIVFPGGIRTLSAISSTYTNDLGEYRLWNLPPGQYLVSAEVNTGAQGILPAQATMIPPIPGGVVIDPITRGSMQSIPDPANVNQRRNSVLLSGAKAPIYYRNAIDDRVATIIDLKPGNDLTGVDFIAGTTAMLPLTINAPAGSTQVRMIFSPGQTTISVNFRPGLSTPAVQFPVAPGGYVIGAQGKDNADSNFIAYGSVEVNPQNPAVVSLAVASPIEVSGRVLVEGQSNNSDVSKVKLRFRRNPVVPGIPDFAVTPVAGSFSKTQAFVDGDYLVEVSGLEGTLGGAYAKSIRARDTALSGNTLHIGSEPVTDIGILLSTRAGQIEGSAVSAGGEAWSNVVVVLAPDQRNRYDLYKTAVTDAGGHFQLQGIAPGTYKLFSWEDVEADGWYNPEFMRTQEDRGKTVQISEAEKQRVDASIIPMR